MKTILIQQKYKDTLAMFIEWTLVQYMTLHFRDRNEQKSRR